MKTQPNGDISPLAEKAAIKTARHASEGGHWYDFDCNQVLEVPSADGKRLVKATLTHARKLDLAPGVTTITGQIDKPAVTLWRCRQAIMAALTLPRRDSETEKEWLDRVEEDMDSHSRSAAEEGTRIHAAVQSHVQGEPFDQNYRQHVDGIMAKLPTDGGKWFSEVTVVSRLGYGTKIDLVNDNYLLDFKSKDGSQEELDELVTYEEHAQQLQAGLAALVDGTKPPPHGLSANWERTLGIVFVSRTHPGACSVRMVGEQELETGWETFELLLRLWQKRRRHVPFVNRIHPF